MHFTCSFSEPLNSMLMLPYRLIVYVLLFALVIGAMLLDRLNDYYSNEESKN